MTAAPVKAQNTQSLTEQELLKPRSWASWLTWGALVIALSLSWKGVEMDPLTLFRDAGNMSQFAKGFFPPSFHDWHFYLEEMLLTVEIALWGSALAIFCSIPLGLLCADNIAPAWVYQPLRRLMDAARAINEMVFAMLFIVAVGLGPFAGVLALWVHTTGVLAKLFSEAVESIDQQPVDGIRATGASSTQEIVYGVIPQVLPLWISYSLYRFEANVRSASVLGMVGAGGIGQILWEIVRSFQYAETAAVLIILIASVTVIDLISSYIRRQFV